MRVFCEFIPDVIPIWTLTLDPVGNGLQCNAGKAESYHVCVVLVRCVKTLLWLAACINLSSESYCSSYHIFNLHIIILKKKEKETRRGIMPKYNPQKCMRYAAIYMLILLTISSRSILTLKPFLSPPLRV